MHLNSALNYYHLMRHFLVCGGLALTSVQCHKADEPMKYFDTSVKPPVAKVATKVLTAHGHKRKDNYYWMRDREDPAVIKYLEKENAYTDAVLAPMKNLRKQLFKELKSRIKEHDSSAPYLNKGFYYYHRYEEGKEYPIYCRKKGSLKAAEEIMLDVNVLAKGHDFFDIGDISVSHNNKLLAYSFDDQGRRKYKITIKDLKTGKHYEDLIEETAGDVTWFADDESFVYAKVHPETLREGEIFLHKLGTDIKKDKVIYREDDETYYVYAYLSKSEKYIFFASDSTETTEVSYLRADDPKARPKPFTPRVKNHKYSVEHADNRFYIRTNWDAQNYRLMQATEKKTNRKEWKELIPHRDNVYFSDFELFKDYLVLQERQNGLNRVRIIPQKDPAKESFVQFDEEAFSNTLDQNEEWDSNLVRVSLSSMKTPETIYDVNLKTGEKTLVKQQEVAGGYDATQYESERLYARARDGKAVAISLVYKKGIKRDGTNPVLLYGYGSYGNTIPPYFSANRLSLLDRGFIFALAHIRGGQTFGRQWYDDGKLLKKMNTFTDFIDCADYLIAHRYTTSKNLYAMGGSAGGLLVGAVMNMRPELFHGVVASVPFVDVVTTMLDESIPLTTFEYDEWGNPKNKEYYHYMLSYSPYDNVDVKDYPNLLVTTGFHDSQVQYWEPAKWIAKLRANNRNKNLILLKTDMSAGHSGKSGRFNFLQDIAIEYAFFIGLAKK